MKIKKFILLILTSIALIFTIPLPHSSANSPEVIWQQNLGNKSMLLQGATTSKNETLLATYTRKNNVNQYEIFKVNNKTKKVKQVSKLSGGKLFLFDVNGKAYILHHHMKLATIYDENFKQVYSKPRPSNLKFITFEINKSKVDQKIFAFGGSTQELGTNKRDAYFVYMTADSKGRLTEIPESKVPGEKYSLYYPESPTITMENLTYQEQPKYRIKVDLNTIPDAQNGFRYSFSSLVITKYNNHFYTLLRKNNRGEGNQRLVKINSKGKVVDYMELPEAISNEILNEPIFIGNQLIFHSASEEHGSYHFINLDNFTEETIVTNDTPLVWKLTNNLYSLYLNGKIHFYNAKNKLQYTSDIFPYYVFDTKERYGLSLTNTIMNLKTGKAVVTSTETPVSIGDNALVIETKSGKKIAKLINLSSVK